MTCRYCGSGLTAKESIRRGYGQDCARRNGQPYGPRNRVPGAIVTKGSRAPLGVRVPEDFDWKAAMSRYLGRGRPSRWSS